MLGCLRLQLLKPKVMKCVEVMVFYPPSSILLENMKISVNLGYKSENIVNKDYDIFVIGNAISADNPEVCYILKNGFKYISFPQLISTCLWEKSQLSFVVHMVRQQQVHVL